MKLKLYCLVLSILSLHFLFAQDKNLFEKQLFISGDDTLPCRILTPINFDIHKKYPLVIFLHGAGERGNDNDAQLNWGADVFLDSLNRSKFPAIVIFPQCPSNDKWSEYNKNSLKDSTGYEFSDLAAIRKPLKLVSDFIDTLLQSTQVDKKSGATNPNKVKDYRKNLPIWIFHGDKDAVINVANSRLLFGILKKTNPLAKYTEYAGVNHDSWKNAFAEPTLLPWLFSQKLNQGK